MGKDVIDLGLQDCMTLNGSEDLDSCLCSLGRHLSNPNMRLKWDRDKTLLTSSQPSVSSTALMVGVPRIRYRLFSGPIILEYTGCDGPASALTLTEFRRRRRRSEQCKTNPHYLALVGLRKGSAVEHSWIASIAVVLLLFYALFGGSSNESGISANLQFTDV